MNGSEPRRKGWPVTVVVYEYVTGGGLAGQDLPNSWAVEGTAMRRAVARDFASVPGVQVIMPLDERLPIEEFPGVELRRISDSKDCLIGLLSDDGDPIVVIAPETDLILTKLARQIEQIRGRSLISGVRSINLTADKARLGFHFETCGIPTPPTLIIGNAPGEFPDHWDGPIVVKPQFGAGSIETVVFRDRQRPTWLSGRTRVIAQPFLPGDPMSASFLVDCAGRPTLLGVGRQRIEIDPNGQISYRGGTILSEQHDVPAVVRSAITSVNDLMGRDGLRGFIGVDYIDDPQAGIVIVEINPRPTTSYVGLARLLGPGMIAGAWLDAMLRPLDETDWPGWFRSLRQGSDLRFDADGTIVPED